MLLLKEHVKALREKLKELSNSRYKILVVWGNIGANKTILARELCTSVGGRYLDVGSELLPSIDRPVLGAYGAGEFIRWIDGELSGDNHLVCFDEIEGLVATFSKAGAVKFFQVLAELETNRSGIVTTYLGNELMKANFPKERIYQLKG